MPGARERLDELCKALEQRLREPPLVFDSNPAIVRTLPEHAGIVALGIEVVGDCVERLQGGANYLAWAVLDITQPADLVLDEAWSDEELAAAVVAWWHSLPEVRFYWSATNGGEAPVGAADAPVQVSLPATPTTRDERLPPRVIRSFVEEYAR